MAAASCLHSEEQFLCSICLDVFTDPVTIPCGHNFCKNCITENWKVNNKKMCPMCKKVYCNRPELHVNTFISEMVAQFKQSAQWEQKEASSNIEQPDTEPEEVPCDVCKLKALKSCVDCLVSYCKTHLEPHLKDSALKKHKLIVPLRKLEGRMCAKHNQPLQLFCKTDQTCFCTSCSLLEHRTHEFVSIRTEYEEKKSHLEKTVADIQKMICWRKRKIQDIEHSVDLSEKDEDRAIAQGVQIFTYLKDTVERGLDELTNLIEEKQLTIVYQADDFIKELEDEISDLIKRISKVEDLSQSEDHLYFLQSFPSLKGLTLSNSFPSKDWTEVSICPPSYEATVVRAVAQLEGTLSEKMKMLFEAELRRLQQFAVDLTFDPDTAHRDLILSSDGKQVKDSDVRKDLPDKPERFSDSPCVLAKQSFSSGRFYYQVQVTNKTKWTLGVVRESINRKEEIPLTPGHGCWTIWLRNRNEYKALTSPSKSLSLKSYPQKVGVFVDYEEGLVSFYDADTAALIYSFTGCCFIEKLYPFFNTCLNDDGKNSSPLIICPVYQSK